MYHPFSLCSKTAMGRIFSWLVRGLLAALILLLAACNLPQSGLESAPPVQNSPTQETVVSTASPAAGPTEPPQASPTEAPAASAPSLPGKAVQGLKPGQKIALSRIDMIDLEHGWGEAVVGEGIWALLRTEDGGKTWAGANPPESYPAGSRFFALDEKTLWAAPAIASAGSGVDHGFVYRTQDGGKTWRQSQPLPLATAETALVESFFPSALFFLDANQGWLAASVGHYMNQDVIVLFSTQDGGLTWTRLTDKFQAGQNGAGAALPCQALGIAFATPQMGWLAGNCMAVGVDERWKVLETNDGGKTWNPRDLPAPENAPESVLKEGAICAPEGLSAHLPGTFILDYRCMLSDPGGNTPTFAFTYVSTDGGSTWNGAQVTSASFSDPRHGAALGPQAQNGQRDLLVTANGGITWNKIYPVNWPEAQLDFIDFTHGWALARRWNNQTGQYDVALVYTQDGGGLWTIVETAAR